MKILKGRKLTSVLLGILCAGVLGLSAGMLSATQSKTATAAAPTASDTVIQLTLDDTNLAPTEDGGKMFDGDGLEALYKAILGTSYTGVGKYNDVKSALTKNGTTTQTWTSLTSSATTVVKNAITASDIRANHGKNIQVKIGKTAFEVVYVTLNNSDEVIVDLWQSESTQTSPWAANSAGSAGYSPISGRSNAASARPGSVYGNSYIRAKMLGQGGDWDQFSGQNSASTHVTGEAKNAMGAYAALWNSMTTGKLANFIDEPSKVDYQEVESYSAFEICTFNNGGSSAGWWKYTLPGDAYGTPYDEYYNDGTVHYWDAGINTGYGGNGTNPITGQDQWKNDKLWLPSLTEIGLSSVVGYSSSAVPGIWGLDTSQCDNVGTSSLNTWLRSGNANRADHAFSLAYSAALSDGPTSNSYAVRPALHLNLKRVQDAAIKRVSVPQDVTVDYDGSAKWLDTLETLTDASGNRKFPWIDSTLHCDTNIVSVASISYTNYDAAGVAVTANASVTSSNVLAAGKYEVTLNISSSQTDYMWRGGGTGNKKFTITINQINVPYTLHIKKGSTAVTSLNYGDTYTHEFSQTAVKPASALPSTIYELLYAGTGSTAASYPASTTAPTDAGTYSLTLKPAPDTANAGKNVASNYKLTGSAINFTIKPKELNIPTVTNPQEYSGSALTFVLADFDSGTYISMDGVTAANGSMVTGAGGAAITDTTDTFEATKVDTYTVSFSLRDTTNYVWKNGSNGAQTVDFYVTEKEFLSTPPVSSAINGIGNAEWEFGDSTVTITITDDRVTGETVNLLCYYDVVGGTSKSNTLTATTTGNVTVINMPATIPVGTYTLTVELNGTTGDNANYKITANNTINFEVTSGKIDPSKYGWIYTKEGAAGSTITNGDKVPFELKTGSTVDGVKYEVSIQIPSSHTAYVEVDLSKYANGYQLRNGSAVGTYSTVVALKSIDPSLMFEDASGNKSATTEVTLTWEIEKGTFDLSAVKWEYSLDGSSWTVYDSANPPQYNDGNYITVRVKASTLPLGLTLDSLYTGSEEYDVDNYTANISVSDFVFNNSNFNDPDANALTLNWEIAKKNLFTGFKNVKDTYSNANGSGTIIIKELNVPAGFESYIQYKYYDMATGLEVTLADIKAAADPTNEKKYKVEAYIDPVVGANYEISDNGSVPSDTFATGSKNKLATVTIGGNDGSTPIVAEYDGSGHFDASQIVITGDDGINVTDFTVKYYTGNRPVAGNELAAGDVPTNAGEYCVEVTLGSVAEKKYILATDWYIVKIEPKGIDLPTLGEMVFNGSELNFEDYLGGSWETYKNIIAVDGKKSDRNVGSGAYITTLTLTDGNYKWLYPAAGTTPTKALLKYSLTADGTSVTGDDKVATYSWNITPLIVDTANMWNKGKSGATLNLPQNIKDLISAGTLEVGYRYYDGDGNYIETPEIKGGRSFKVEAVFAGDDSVRNVQFKRSDTELGATSAGVDYTVPQSGAAVFFGKALSFLKKNWWWLLIALAVLLFLIILIVVLVKRSKNKEEREEKKRLKEEEKARREEERRRQEEEREAERRRHEQELELERAKQEAELAKMKAELGLGAGVAGVAVAAQQPAPQPQVQYVPQPAADPSVLAEIKAELAEIKARQNMNAQYAQMPMQMPMMQMPMQTYGPQPMSYGGGNGGSSNDPVMVAELTRLKAENEAHMRVELERARTETERARADAEIAKVRAESGRYSQPQPQYQSIPLQAGNAPVQYVQAAVQPQPPQQQQPFSAEALGSIIGGVLRGMNVPVEKRTETKLVVEQQSQPVTVETPTVYPADAVITTTTTVDTTKNKPSAPRADDGRLFDVDGFYDTFEENK